MSDDLPLGCERHRSVNRVIVPIGANVFQIAIELVVLVVCPEAVFVEPVRPWSKQRHAAESRLRLEFCQAREGNHSTFLPFTSISNALFPIEGTTETDGLVSIVLQSDDSNAVSFGDSS